MASERLVPVDKLMFRSTGDGRRHQSSRNKVRQACLELEPARGGPSSLLLALRKLLTGQGAHDP